MKRVPFAALSLALALALCLVLAPSGAQAASSTGGQVNLYDTGGSAPNASTDWSAKVDQPMFVLNNGEDDLVLDITMVKHDASAANASYVITVVIDDGTTELTGSKTINTASGLTGNITFTAANLATLAETNSATVTYTLALSGSTLDTYVWEDVTIDDDQAMGAFGATIPMLIGVFALMFVFSALGGMFTSMSKAFRKE